MCYASALHVSPMFLILDRYRFACGHCLALSSSIRGVMFVLISQLNREFHALESMSCSILAVMFVSTLGFSTLGFMSCAIGGCMCVVIHQLERHVLKLKRRKPPPMY